MVPLGCPIRRLQIANPGPVPLRLVVYYVLDTIFMVSGSRPEPLSHICTCMDTSGYLSLCREDFIFCDKYSTKDASLFFSRRRNLNFSPCEWSFMMKMSTLSRNDLHFHDLRHIFCSNLIISGANLKEVKEMIGHSDIVMKDRYSHLTSEHKLHRQKRLAEYYAHNDASQVG